MTQCDTMAPEERVRLPTSPEPARRESSSSAMLAGGWGRTQRLLPEPMVVLTKANRTKPAHLRWGVVTPPHGCLGSHLVSSLISKLKALKLKTLPSLHL